MNATYTDLKSIDKKYKCIVADPPWEYRNKKTGGSMKSAAVDKYNTMSLEEIGNLPINEIADKNAVLFLWITTPLKPEILEANIAESWGFKKYNTTIYWRKIMSMGLGFWFRGQIEECLVYTRGDIKAFRCQKPNFIQCRAGRHSEKPEQFFRLVEPIIEQFNLNPKIELFARKRRYEWDSFGNETTSSNNYQCQRKLQLEV